jgi:hypothetical protein
METTFDLLTPEVAALVAFVTVVLSLTVWLVRQPRRGELQAVVCLCDDLRAQVDAALSHVSTVRTSHLGQEVERAVAPIRVCVEEESAQVPSRVSTHIDNEIYKRAATTFAHLPGARDQFHRSLAERSDLIVNRSRLTETVKTGAEGLFRALNEHLQNVDAELARSAAAQMPMGDAAIERLLRQPARAGRFLGDTVLAQFMRRDQQLNCGEIVYRTLRTTCRVIDTISPNRHTPAVVKLTIDLLGLQVIEQISDEIYAWAVAEFGQSMLWTVGETFVDIATGVLAVWRVFRAWSAYRRFFVDKEPLVKMRSIIRERTVNALATLPGEVESSLRASADAHLAQVERHLRELRREALKRRAWAMRRLRLSPLSWVLGTNFTSGRRAMAG